jgi:hypothetical protein
MTDETYEQRLAAQQRREILEADSPRARYQRLLDHWWQQQIDQTIEEDRWRMVAGFLEPRHSTTCHRGKGDSDY